MDFYISNVSSNGFAKRYMRMPLRSIFSSNFWEQITDLVTCFKPINDATLALQREQLTISDFYMEWLNCKAKVESTRIPFANELAHNMKARERNLLNTDLVFEN